MNKDKQIIAKQKEVIDLYRTKDYTVPERFMQLLTKLESELQALESEAEPDKELFEKVYIRDEKDCPQEGYYFCNRSGFDSVQRLIPVLGKSYMREIRWYLKPLK